MYNFLLGNTQFPVAPPSMSLTVNNQNETVTLVNEGQVNLLKKPGLTDIEFELLLPNKQYPFAIYNNGFQPSSFYLTALEKAKVDQEALPFIVTRMFPDGQLMFDTNMMVSLEDYVIQEDAEDLGFDVRVTIQLKQWREYGTKKLKVQQASTTNSTQKVTVEKKRATTGKKNPENYSVKQGDTLYGLAKKYLGDGTRYPEIQKLNNISNPSIISVGQKIKIPEVNNNK